MFDVVCDFIMSRWPGSNIVVDNVDGFVEADVYIGDCEFVSVVVGDCGVSLCGSGVFVCYCDPLFFEKLVGIIVFDRIKSRWMGSGIVGVVGSVFEVDVYCGGGVFVTVFVDGVGDVVRSGERVGGFDLLFEVKLGGLLG